MCRLFETGEYVPYRGRGFCDSRFCVFNLINHSLDFAMMVSYQTVTNERCLYIMHGGKYDSVDEGIRKRAVEPFEDGKD